MSVVEDLRPAPQDVPYRAKTAANPDGMRVLHVTEAPLGGVAAYLEEIVQFQGGDPFASVEVLTPEINAPLLSKAAHPAVRIVQYKHRRKSIASLARLGWATFSRAWRTRPDIIHIHSTIAGGVVRAIRPVLPWKSRIVYCAHGWAFSRDGDRLKTRLVAQVERLLSLMTDQIICISQSEFKEAMRFGLPARKCVVIQNGVGASGPPDMSRRKTARGPKVIAFIGRFDHQKGFDTYINVLRRLGPDAKGIAVGQYIVSQQEDDTELPANLTVLGWMDREGVKKVMESADLLLMPSRWEGFGLVAVEAMRAGLPVFASRIGGPAEIVIPGHTGFLFDPEDPETIAELIRSQPADALHDMGQNGYYRYLELYTSERMNQRILDLYQSMARVLRMFFKPDSH